MKRSVTPVLYYVGRRVFLAGSEHDSAEITDPSQRSAALLTALESAGKRGRVVLVWEPFGFTHARVDCPPRVDRKTFAAIAEIQREHQAVVSDSLGWGYEQPKADGTAIRTWLHAETVPELSAAGLALVDEGWKVDTAWSLATLALRVLEEGKCSHLVVLAPPFVGVYIDGRSRGGSGARSKCESFDLTDDHVRSQVFELLTDSGVNGGILDNRQRSTWMICGTDAEIEAFAQQMAREGSDEPTWRSALNDVKRCEWNDLTKAAVRTSSGYSANLWESFPVPFPLGKLLRAGATMLAVCAAVFAILWFLESKNANANNASTAALIGNLSQQRDRYNANKGEIDRLNSTVGSAGNDLRGEMPRGRAQALRALATAVPETFTITRFVLSPENSVEAQFLRITDNATPEALTREWQRVGFTWNAEDKKESEKSQEGEDRSVLTIKGTWTRGNLPPPTQGSQVTTVQGGTK